MENKSVDIYKALYDIAVQVYSSTSTETVLNDIVRSTALALGLKGCSLMLLSPNRKQLIHTASYGLSEPYLGKGPVGVGPILAEVLKGNPVAVDDVTTDQRVQYRDQAIREGIVSMLSVPMVLRNETTGVLRVYTNEPRHFTFDDIQFLHLVASLGAIALKKAREYESQEEYYEQRLREKVNQLEAATMELEKLEEGKKRLLTFMSIVAHDLKSPLAAIQSYFGVMLGGYAGELNDKHRQMIERSSTRIDELLELISDLLDISRIETGQTVQEMKEVSLVELCRNPVEDAQRLAEHKKIRLAASVERDLPAIYGSPIRIRQLFTNLLSNAVKFTPEGGNVNFSLYERNGFIVGEVKDNGAGIPEEDLEHVFNDFYRASNVEVPGTGLGLPIVKRIVESHGGEIKVESPCPDTGTGCRFIFTLYVED
ncbi:MAG: GAF domain-containing sensor histidine kinase [Dehalococcoidia bacterium]